LKEGLRRREREAGVALDVTDIIATQRQLIGTVLGGIVAVATVASLLSVFLARRISRPLEHLAKAATLLSKGDLTKPLVVQANVREVALVAQALEGARVDLQSTLAELRHEKDWTDHLLEAIVEGIVTLDRHGQINFFSRGAERITGWTRDQVIGRACDKVFQPAETDELFSRLIPALGQRRKIPVKLRDGRMAVLAVSSTQLRPADLGSDAFPELIHRFAVDDLGGWSQAYAQLVEALWQQDIAPRLDLEPSPMLLGNGEQ